MTGWEERWAWDARAPPDAACAVSARGGAGEAAVGWVPDCTRGDDAVAALEAARGCGAGGWGVRGRVGESPELICLRGATEILWWQTRPALLSAELTGSDMTYEGIDASGKCRYKKERHSWDSVRLVGTKERSGAHRAKTPHTVLSWLTGTINY